MTPDPAVEVRLLSVPVGLWERAQQQSEALQREFALLVDQPGHELPARLLELVAELRATYGSGTTDQEATLLDAADAGLAELPELVYVVPAAVGAHAQELGRLLDEADEHCRSGGHLLTLAAEEDVVRFRWWYLDEFTGQCAGRAPVPWPAYRR